MRSSSPCPTVANDAAMPTATPSQPSAMSDDDGAAEDDTWQHYGALGRPSRPLARAAGSRRCLLLPAVHTHGTAAWHCGMVRRHCADGRANWWRRLTQQRVSEQLCGGDNECLTAVAGKRGAQVAYTLLRRFGPARALYVPCYVAPVLRSELWRFCATLLCALARLAQEPRTTAASMNGDAAAVMEDVDGVRPMRFVAALAQTFAPITGTTGAGGPIDNLTTAGACALAAWGVEHQHHPAPGICRIPWPHGQGARRRLTGNAR